MKKFIVIGLIAIVLPIIASADTCGEEFVYTKTNDFADSRVEIDFETAFGQPRNQIDVLAKSGYSVTKVELDVVGDGYIGFHTYTLSAVTDYNPNPGYTIDAARVTVKADACVPPPVDVCPNLDGAQAVVPEGHVLQDGQCVIPVPIVDVCPNLEGNQATIPAGYHDEAGQCVADVVIPPVDLCANIEGVQDSVPVGYHQDGANCVADVAVPPVDPITPPTKVESGGGLGTGHCDRYNKPSCADWFAQFNEFLSNGGQGTFMYQENLVGGSNPLEDQLNLLRRLVESLQQLVSLL